MSGSTGTPESLAKSPFSPIRRVITGHTLEGKSTILRDETTPALRWFPDKPTTIYDFYRTNEHPAKLDSELTQGEWVDEIAKDHSLVSTNGSTFRSIDYPPGSEAPFHRTPTIDYAIVTKGSVTALLEDGSTSVLKEGDVFVQRGTLHGWKNETNEWARIFFVMLASEPIKINGEVLSTGVPPIKPIFLDKDGNPLA
ncbi:hypothetical protein K474DRAFT_1429548 [Panus rudis PR-1116 ss-1]|nr:hypothetical protein K474DRAFT_1429548 [Panus rudis PR-1116 ss-1]